MTEPTDAEISDLYAEQTGFDLNESPAALLDFARAVLAKWGTPQPVVREPPAPRVEPVAWLNPWRADQVTTDYDAYGKHGIPLYTAPQPVVREPLSDAQIAEMMRDTWGCASIAPRHALEFARAVERAHGIKGGQHGAE
jgi:hypothetical protein